MGISVKSVPFTLFAVRPPVLLLLKFYYWKSLRAIFLFKILIGVRATHTRYLERIYVIVLLLLATVRVVSTSHFNFIGEPPSLLAHNSISRAVRSRLMCPTHRAPMRFLRPPSRSDLLRRRDNPRHRPPRSDVGDVSPCAPRRAAQSDERISRRACASECGRLDHSHFAPRPFLVPFLRSRLPPAPSPLRVSTCFLSLTHRGPLSRALV